MAQGFAIKRYNRAVVLLSIAYVVLLISALVVIKRAGLTGPLAYALAILPALPIIGMFAAIGLYLVRESDEYLRLLRVRQALVASGFALSIATAWGFLEAFDLAPHIEAYWIAVIWFAGLGVGSCVNVALAARQQ
ncbi:hypothetical protein [Allosphingosinicella vermicomposti]|uniref:hypothetical protein n=1 Tax=Allosphingosinicella vermicomposti TaxID=614671 RepID=UPI001FDFA87D|nr:hypothetical protein [Allosphingosinicella vermicomposti]